ncbi:hypothetical protein [Sulfitobacter sp. M13]
MRNPDEHLPAYTIMFRRAADYDPENADWYWVKHLPDGALDQTPDGVAMARQVAKGMDEGCIACHKSAGEDMVFASGHLAALSIASKQWIGRPASDRRGALCLIGVRT